MDGGKKAPLSKTYRTCPTLIKLSTVIPDIKNHVRHPLGSTDISDFSSKIIISGNTDIDCILIHNYSFHFFESSRVVLINMVAILMMSAKLAPPSLLKKSYLEIKVMMS